MISLGKAKTPKQRLEVPRLLVILRFYQGVKLSFRMRTLMIENAASSTFGMYSIWKLMSTKILRGLQVLGNLAHSVMQLSLFHVT
jgi:hypothetical protein